MFWGQVCRSPDTAPQCEAENWQLCFYSLQSFWTRKSSRRELSGPFYQKDNPNIARFSPHSLVKWWPRPVFSSCPLETRHLVARGKINVIKREHTKATKTVGLGVSPQPQPKSPPPATGEASGPQLPGTTLPPGPVHMLNGRDVLAAQVVWAMSQECDFGQVA